MTFFFFVGIGKTATIKASSCKQDAVQSAINSASEGDTVIVPPGTARWTKEVLIKSKGITILGSGIGKTVITCTGGRFFNVEDSSARISGFEFKSPEGSSADKYIAVYGHNWRIDHCKFDNQTTQSRVGVLVRFHSTFGQPSGLIDNNTFINCRVYVLSSLVKPENPLWAADIQLGTNQTVFIEDNKFDRTVMTRGVNAVDSQYGGSYVFRFNNVLNANLEAHAVWKGSEPARGGRLFEIYGNTLSHNGNHWNRAIFIRGGTGIIFNNSIKGYKANRIDLDVHSQRDGTCNGSNPADGNEDKFGYPCRDQPGRGKDKWQWTSSKKYPPQELQPIYIWNNIGALPTNAANGDDVVIKKNRDFYEQIEHFDGTEGMGVGKYSDRPSTCTKNVAYWATDQGNWNRKGESGILYKCVSKNTWEKYYIPFTYPHPLQSGQQSDITAGDAEDASPPGAPTESWITD